ncbi:unnamed protein product [Paramecium sonneborni]|uniref:Uncharacterized protein n=1 Tax=Paramecium sonneborni TaxID=65129 RepID=A0A8S1RTQ2_9CILI|nr:unnamed protein product [Paramecium sonneborni]
MLILSQIESHNFQKLILTDPLSDQIIDLIFEIKEHMPRYQDFHVQSDLLEAEYGMAYKDDHQLLEELEILALSIRGYPDYRLKMGDGIKKKISQRLKSEEEEKQDTFYKIQ